MELVIALANKLETLSSDVQQASKTVNFHGNDQVMNFGSAKLDSSGLRQAFVVSERISQYKVDWLVEYFDRPLSDDFESEFMKGLASTG